eukprot:m.625698 g.625698  ORF g.625698 m.625698 type:complete len:271 (+) comp22549_c1_seq10:3445-4257(+)
MLIRVHAIEPPHPPRLSTGVFLKTFVHGNLSADTAIRMNAMVVDTLQLTPLPKSDFPALRTNRVAPGTTRLELPNPNSADDNSYVELYYQIGKDTIKDCVKTLVLEAVMSEPCFNELRTVQQLAYDVDCGLRCTNGYLGFAISAQPVSSSFSVIDTEARMEIFFETFLATLKDMPQDEFADYVHSLIEERSRPETNLAELTNKFWGEITSCAYMFDRDRREVEALRKVKKAEIVKWFRTHIHPESSSRRKLGSKHTSQCTLAPVHSVCCT